MVRVGFLVLAFMWSSAASAGTVAGYPVDAPEYEDYAKIVHQLFGIYEGEQKWAAKCEMKSAPSPDFDGRDVAYGECKLSGEYCFIKGRSRRICHNGEEADIIWRTTGIKFNKKRTKAKLRAQIFITKECRGHAKPVDFIRPGQWRFRKKDGTWVSGLGRWGSTLDMRFRCRE